jgi:hypothetical protein
MSLPFLPTCREVIAATSILVPFAALRHTLVSLILHPGFVALLRLIRERVAPVSARTWILKVSFLIGFRCKNSGGVEVADDLCNFVTGVKGCP